MGYGASGYLIKPDIYLNEMKKTLQNNPLIPDALPIYALPIMASDNWLLMDTKTNFPGDLISNYKNIKFNLIGKNVLNKKLTLNIKFNGFLFETLVPSGLFKIQIPIDRKYLRDTNTQELEFTTSEFYIPKEIDPNIPDGRKIAISVSDAYLSDGKVSSNIIKKASEIQPLCEKNKLRDAMECHIDTTSEVNYLQLPLLYYPNMLDIRIDGRENNNYYPYPCDSFYCATLKINPGQHDVSFKFRGINWANYMSLLSWLIYFVLVFFIFRNKRINLFNNSKIIHGAGV